MERNPFFGKLLVGVVGVALMMGTMTQCTPGYLFNRSGGANYQVHNQNPVKNRVISPGAKSCTGPNCRIRR